jgi:filamin
VNPRQVLRLADQGKTFVVEDDKVSTQLPLQCTASGLDDGENHIPYGFTIHTQKEAGGGHPVGVSVTSPNGEIKSSLEVSGQNNYKVNFTPSSDGPHKINITFQVTATIDVSVGAMVPDPIQCLAYGPGLEAGEQFKDAIFTIEARNKLGVKIPFGGHNFTAHVTNPFGEDVPVEVVDLGDGTYKAVYVPIVPGDHIVEVKLNTDHIKNSPFKVPIDWSSEWAHPANSYAKGPGLEDGNKTRQNKPSAFTIFAVDKHGKRRTTGGDLFDVNIEDPLFDQITPTIVDKGDGTYDVTYQAKEPGVNQISIFLRNRKEPVMFDHISDSPKNVNVQLGTDPSKCTADGPGLKDGIQDTDPAEFKVQARDRNGNPINYGGEPFKATAKDPSGQDVPVDIKDNGDGTYDVVFNPDIDGPHTVDVQLDDTHIKDMPKIVNVVPGAWAGTSKVETVYFLCQTKDKRGNNLTVGGQAPTTTVGGNNKNIPVKLADHNNGTYTYEFTHAEPHGSAYKITSTIKGNNLYGTPIDLKL